MSASMLDRPWEAMLDAAVALGIGQIEACGGGHIPTLHFDPVRLASDPDELRRFRASLEERELSLCAFSCHGNPLHPDPERARRDHDDFVATCRVASELGVGFVSLLAGLPAGAPGDRTPNWVINSAFPGLGERLPLAVGGAGAPVLARGGTDRGRPRASCSASSRTRRTWSTTRPPSGACATRSAR